MSTPPSYRELLQLTAQESQRSYDQTVIALSGGALGISISFLDKVAPAPVAIAKPLLIASWIAWTLSLAAMLFSFFASTRALNEAIVCVDKGQTVPIDTGWDRVTTWANAGGGLLLVIGVVCFLVFSTINFLQRKDDPMSTQKTPSGLTHEKIEKGLNIPRPPSPTSGGTQPKPQPPAPTPPMPGQNIPPPPPPGPRPLSN